MSITEKAPPAYRRTTPSTKPRNGPIHYFFWRDRVPNPICLASLLRCFA